MLYPGPPIALKRIRYSIIVLLLGLNFYVNDVENRLTNHLVNQAHQIDSISSQILDIKAEIPNEIKGEYEKDALWLARQFVSLPDEGKINQAIRTANSSLAAAQSISQHIAESRQPIQWLIFALNIGFYFGLISILISFIWMYQDATKGKSWYARLIIMCMVPVWIYSYQWAKAMEYDLMEFLKQI